MAAIAGKTALVTGASSGMGKLTVERLLDQGVRVYAASRRVELMKDIESKGAKIVAMDLTDDSSVTSGVARILAEAGTVDILVNNAGYGSYGAVEDVPIDEARRQFEVNLFGLARLTQLVLPGMREKRFGKIVNITSMGGKVYSPFGAWYHATKHALEGWSDCLRIETAEFGIDVVVIEPGGIKTDWGIIAADNLVKTSGTGAYRKKAQKAAEMMKESYSGDKMTKPAVIADLILKSLTAEKPKRRYLKGYMAKPIVFIRKWFGDGALDAILRSLLKE